VVEFAADPVRTSTTLWNEPGGDFAIMKEIKKMFDPGNLLNRGRLYGQL
jgi:FAD/FMN-containing dehydrogenase